ncbi:MAG TPA: SAM-dependent methyltransferase, partial [Thermoanaerobaculia bacterium]|nr:SAM-dependent methyltransferase [Thermoanaerobaculia bacterium]
SFAVVTAHRAADLDDLDWPALSRVDTLVVLMGVARLPYVAANLARAGRPRTTPAAIVERGTWEDERVVTCTLADLAERAAEAGVRSPATVVIGEAVALRRTPGAAAEPPHRPAQVHRPADGLASAG